MVGVFLRVISGKKKVETISEEMFKYARQCRGKHQRSERTDGSRETNKYRKFSLCEANIMHCKLFYNGYSAPPEAAAKNDVFSDVSGLLTSEGGLH